MQLARERRPPWSLPRHATGSVLTVTLCDKGREDGVLGGAGGVAGKEHNRVVVVVVVVVIFRQNVLPSTERTIDFPSWRLVRG